MQLLYITYIDFGNFQSGSSVRPQMMYEAFRELGWEVKLLQTQQNKRAQRRAAVEEISRWLDEGNRPDFCYVESPSGPIFNLCDKILLRKIRRLGIKIGYFYRDAAFRFDNIFIKGQKTPKQHAIAAMSELDVKFLERTADIVYLPTKSMAKYFSFPCMMTLPPACSGSIQSKVGHTPGRSCIYVGGVSKRYGTDILLGAFDLLNADGEDYPLTLVCRESETGYIPQEYREKPWLHIVHASGKESLKPFYQAADLALYPIEKNDYNDFALSVRPLRTECAEGRAVREPVDRPRQTDRQGSVTKKLRGSFMKIAFISAARSIHTVKWVNFLARRGHEVRLYSLPDHENKLGNIDPAVNIVYLEKSGFAGYFTNAPQLRRQIRDFAPDIVNAHYASGYGTLAALSRVHPLLLSVWGSDVYDFPLKSPVHKQLVKRNLEKADAVASTSRVMADRVRRVLRYNKPIFITPFGVDTSLFCPGEEPGGQRAGVRFGTVKALEDKYGMDYLIRAFAMVKKRLPDSADVTLEIYGKGSRREALQGLINSLGLSDCAKLCGAVKSAAGAGALHAAQRPFGGRTGDKGDRGLRGAAHRRRAPGAGDHPGHGYFLPAEHA